MSLEPSPTGPMVQWDHGSNIVLISCLTPYDPAVGPVQLVQSFGGTSPKYQDMLSLNLNAIKCYGMLCYGLQIQAVLSQVS